MADKTEEQIAADKAALDAMRNARANMETALRRIESLEYALRNAIEAIRLGKSYVSAQVYVYPQGNGTRKTCHEELEERIAAAQKVLG